jgi:trehalose 6-phosphate phosphatase
MRPLGLCTDIDGTISLVAPTVDAAVLLPGVAELLARAVDKFDVVATISGRGVEDQHRMIGIDGVAHVGHHGYEWEELDTTGTSRLPQLLPEAAPYQAKVAAALDEIEAELAPQIPGLWMERKGITGGVHWRLADDKIAAEQLSRRVVRRVAKAHGLRYRGGKLAFELFPPVVTTKGDGIRRLIEQHGLKAVVYLGDDLSDTDAFRMLRGLRARGSCMTLSVGVLHADSPTRLIKSADIVVDGPGCAKSFIEYLVESRQDLSSAT